MARSVNKVTLVGVVGNLENRQTQGGNAVVNISLATDESYNDRNTGNKVEQTEWHRTVAFGKLAEIITQYVTVGSKLYLEGKLKTREWEKDGVKRYSTEIVISEMVMLGGGQNQGQNQGQGRNQGQGQYQGQNQGQGQYQQQPMQQQQQQRPMQQQQQQPMQQQQQGQNWQGAGQGQNGFNQFEDDIPF